MKFLNILLLAAVLASPVVAQAAEAPPATAEAPKQDPATLDKRMELSKQWHKIMPVSVREQVNSAIDEVTRTLPDNEREAFRTNLRSILNYQAIEKISTDAVAEVYTVTELEAMIEYYSKPEGKSAQLKFDSYAGKVYPEITRMLDQAIMRVRTGGQ